SRASAGPTSSCPRAGTTGSASRCCSRAWRSSSAAAAREAEPMQPGWVVLLLAGAVMPAAAQGQGQGGPGLPDLAIMMRGPELYGRSPESVRWSPDGSAIWFRWLEPGARWDEPLDWYRVPARAGARP